MVPIGQGNTGTLYDAGARIQLAIQNERERAEKAESRAEKAESLADKYAAILKQHGLL